MPLNPNEIIWDDAPQINPQEVQWDNAPTPQQPQEQGFLNRVGAAISQRGQNIANTWTPANPNEGAVESFTRGPQRYWNTAGNVFGGVNDIAVEGAKSLYKTFTPTPMQQAISGYGQDFMNSGLGQMGMRALQSGVGQWERFKQLYPDAATHIESSTNIAFGAPIAKAATPLITAPVKTAKKAVSGVGRTAKETIGAATGSGPGAVEEALKGGSAFQKALRGEITGDEIVGNAKEALGKIVEKRNTDYVAKLDKIKTNPEKLATVKTGLDDTVTALMKQDRFDIGISLGRNRNLEYDFSKSTIVEHQPVVKKALEDVMGWNDNTAKGLDTLKKRLGSYIDQTGRETPARKMLTEMRNSLDTGIKKAVPEYAGMTKKYAEATQLIKDIESGLLMKQQGLSGRITADQTLRRLTSAMRENFELRKELVEVLGAKGGEDLAGQVAGYSMNQMIPRGLVGKLAAGSGLIYLNPKMWPLVVASSPRVMGEFLHATGMAKNKVKAIINSVTQLKAKK